MASITLTPALGIVGASITVTGSGFGDNLTLSATIGGNILALLPALVQTDASGNIPVGTTFVVPAMDGNAGNPYTVNVSDGSVSANADFSFVAAVSLSSSSGYVGDSVTITGSGFSYASGFQPITYLTFDTGGADIDILATPAPVVASDGSWSQAFIVPHDTKGLKAVTADDASGEGYPHADFTINPAITLSDGGNTHGFVGDTVTATGTGYTTTILSTATFATAAGALSLIGGFPTPNATGDFTTSFLVPATIKGAHVVTLASVTATAGTNFTTDPLLILQYLGTGWPGRVIGVTGTGFSTSNAMSTFTFNGLVPTVQTVTTASTDAHGSFPSAGTATFTVDAYPCVVAGYPVVATDAGGASDTETFKVEPHINFVGANSGVVGDTITVAGVGWTYALGVTLNSITLETVVPGTQTVTGTAVAVDGSWAAQTFVIPDVTGGPDQLLIGSTISDSAQELVTVSGSMTTSLADAIVGTAAVHIYGHGFTTTATPILSVTYNTHALTVAPAHPVIGADGQWTATFTVPHEPAGSHAIEAKSQASVDDVTCNFIIDTTFTLSPSSGHVGAVVTVAGTGYDATSNVSVFTFNGVAPAGQTVTGHNTAANGNYSQVSPAGKFTVPAIAKGTYNVIMTDAGGATKTVTFAVTPAISLAPISGDTGDTVTVTGSGFSTTILTSATIGVALTSILPLAPPTPSGIGAFTFTFIVPDLPDGTQTVTVRNAASTATASFNEIASMTLTPTYSGNATVISIVGTGFTHLDAILTLTINGITPPNNTCIGAVVDVTGTWKGTITVPLLDLGVYTIVVTDTHDGTVTATLTILDWTRIIGGGDMGNGSANYGIPSMIGESGLTVLVDESEGVRPFKIEKHISKRYPGNEDGTNVWES
jgi:hypothetical protein